MSASGQTAVVEQFITWPAAYGRGCVKTQKRPLEIDYRVGEFSVEVSRLLTERYRFLGQLIESHDVFEGDFWSEAVVKFSHSLGRKQPLGLSIF